MSDSTFTRPASSPSRKRTASTSEKKHPLAGRRTPSRSSHKTEGQSEKYHHHRAGPSEDGGGRSKKGKEYDNGWNGPMNGMEIAPSLNVDIRNSLILPSLSQRFSVLLPSLSTAPEESLRSLLASQRARHHGPALTEEEEELLFAEMRDAAQEDQWDGRPPQMDENWVRSGLGVKHGRLPTSSSSPSLLTTSTSSPSVLSSYDDGQGHGNAPSTPGSFLSSPPPISNSFSSFQTFGVGSSPDASNAGFKTRSYGFSGGSGMREAEYIRKVKKSFSHKDLKSGSISSKKSDGTPTSRNIPLLPAISPEKANAYYQPTKRAESPTTSEKTATPTSSVIPNISSSLPSKGHSPSSSLNLNPPTPNSAEDPMFAGKHQKARKRQSRLDGLTPAQVKRISLALQEIGGQLKRGSMAVQAVPDKVNKPPTPEEVEEMLDPVSRRASQLGDDQAERVRRPSDLRSEDSCQSATSSVFPFQMSPTNSTFTGVNTEPSSPSKLPPSPRTHNLLAHVEEALPPIPMPVFTPTRSQPVRHQPTLSNSSTSTVAPNQPVYIPGQPRPIRLTHHSQSSVSSRSATPSNQSPLDAIRTAISPDNTPSPIKGIPNIAERCTSLGRSRSVNQAQTTPTKSADHELSHHPNGGSRRRAGTIGEAPINRRLSSSLSSHPSTPDIIEEADETPSDRDKYTSSPQLMEEFVPEVKQVMGRRSVANSRTTSSNSIHQLHHNLGWELAPGQEPFERSVSAQGTIDESPNDTPPNEDTAPLSPTTTLRRQASSTSISSSFSEDAQMPGEIVWASVFNDDSPDGFELVTDGMRSPEPGQEAEVLRKMSGMGMEEMMLLQEKLVLKARAEREALRGHGDDDTYVPYSPPMSAEAFSPTQRAMSPILGATSPDLARPISPPPPSSWRFPPAEPLQQSSSQSTTPSQEKSTLPSSVDTHILTPPLTGSSTGGSVSRSGSKSHNPIMLPTRPAPPPPQQPVATPSEDTHDTQSPPAGDLSRKSSNRAHFRVPLEQDPEVRKDFEARIAAATAALNHTPSVSNSKLDRKFSKKGAPMVISSPKLVSSTANVPTTPLTPENQVETGSAKTSEKSSGSGSKMSLKWKKFTGLRSKGRSFSGNEVTPFPAAQPTQTKLSPTKQLQQQQHQQMLSQQQQQSKLSPIQNVAMGQGGPQRSASASVAQRLKDPIHLRADDHPEAPPSAPPNLDAFRFPPPPERAGPPPAVQQQEVPSPPSSLGHSSGLKHVMSKMKRSKETSPPPQQPQGRSQSPVSTQSNAMGPLPAIDAVTEQQPRHTPTSSDDDARNKFIEAGRALGLNEGQLNDMLAAKGMAGTTSTALAPIGPSPPPAVPVNTDEKAVKQEKEKKGLFRSLSKARKAQPSPSPATIGGLAPSAPVPEPIPIPPAQDRVIVRRTMILPEGLNIIPSTPSLASHTPKIPESPDSASLRPGLNQPRKQSIRRKPLKLSEEDHELVSNSPPAHRRNFSFSNASADSNGTNTPTKPSFTPSPSNSQTQVPTTSGAGTGELHGLGFLHPNSTPLTNKTSAPSLTPSPGNSSNGGGDDESHTRSSTGGSLIDMYRGDDDEELLESPDKNHTAAFGDNDENAHARTRRALEDAVARGSLDRRRMTQAVEITEYADGQVIWNIVDALRTSVTGSVDGEEYTFDTPGAPHSRTTSYSSSVRNSVIPEDDDVFHAAGNNAGWPKALGNGTAGLNFRHRDRNVVKKPRPPTDVYFTSHADVADLIDHLSRDLDASHGRIDIISHPNSDDNEWPPSNSSPFAFQDSTTTTIPTTPERQPRRSSQIHTQSPAHSQFEDAPSPAQVSLRPTISPVKANNHYTAGAGNTIENLSPGPQRQLFHENEIGSRGQSYMSAPGLSPSSKSFASSVSGQGKSVEDRLQALLDRLKGDGIGRTRL
ncbi:hypothetical protein I302_102584 [Kwoniella bestiolae CBS 10118]|uniref:Uncharacterized protein n=1 Tax=Kwoniella bestiolae CBS 10118 TaxID=1296100 RepID=A0A1B9GFI7_9TREE|nr:hypothetical protein I302_01271 [Kwoniella bestiolae CBS 10118]OCF29758.1 hypothetical protein I302_01271 [Kwoniella bestiolae CBS 10118]